MVSQQYRIINELGLSSAERPDNVMRSPGGKREVIRVSFRDWMLQEDLDVELVGICDVFDLNAEIGLETGRQGLKVNGKKGGDCSVKHFRTYKELLEDKVIDAVMVATPDHHHARISTDTFKAGKHVY